MKTATVTALALALSAGAALADWSSRIEGPDLFDVTKVSAGVAAGTDGLIVSCTSKGKATVAFVFRIALAATVAKVPGEIFVRIDGGSIVAFPAMLGRWNGDHAAVRTTEADADLEPLIVSLSHAKRSIEVGMRVDGETESNVFSADGIEPAFRPIFEHCRKVKAGS